MNTEPSNVSTSPKPNPQALADAIAQRAKNAHQLKLDQVKIDKLVSAYQKRDDLTAKLNKLVQELKHLTEAIKAAEEDGDYNNL